MKAKGTNKCQLRGDRVVPSAEGIKPLLRWTLTKVNSDSPEAERWEAVPHYRAWVGRPHTARRQNDVGPGRGRGSVDVEKILATQV
jgi:hypothetical protein